MFINVLLLAALLITACTTPVITNASANGLADLCDHLAGTRGNTYSESGFDGLITLVQPLDIITHASSFDIDTLHIEW